MEKGKTYRFPYKDSKAAEIPGPSQVVIDIFKDIEELTKGRNQISEKELNELKVKYGIQQLNDGGK